MDLIQRLIPASNTYTRPGIKMDPKYITIHETDNTDAGADAEAHARLQERGNTRQASWHVQVDDKQAIQSIPFNEVAWAAGDGPNGPGNLTSIHIEICVNSDGNYQKAVQNAAEITRQLMQPFSISTDHVVQHNHWTGKDCPRIMRSGSKGITWNDFIKLCTIKNGWIKENSKWYFYKNDIKQTGWLLDNGKWYYLRPEMAVGWIEYKNKDYYLGKDGAMITGWLKDDSKWYFLDKQDGYKHFGWVLDEDQWYYLNPIDGAMVVGWVTHKNDKYYMSRDGSMVTGWNLIDGKWFFFTDKGSLAHDTEIIVKSVALGSDGSITKIE